MNILIADDHPSFRRGVKEILIEALKPLKIGEAGDALEMLELIRRKTWDLVVMDISMPGQMGLEALKGIKEECACLRVLVLTMHPEDQYAIRMIKAGANGYLSKASAPSELLRAIKIIMAGGRYVSSVLGEQLAMKVKGLGGMPHERLSDREYQVFCMIGSGKSVSEIAEAIHLSVTTISTYRARILEKMSMNSNADLTRYAMQVGLV
jgi:DNA-binding NarL/FixJ family response regulator